METKIAVAYARFSSEKQNHTSIEVQIAKIEEFCKKYNILLIEKYVDEAKVYFENTEAAIEGKKLILRR